MSKRAFLIDMERQCRSYGEFMFRLSRMASSERSRQELQDDARRAIERADACRQTLKELDDECAA